MKTLQKLIRQAKEELRSIVIELNFTDMDGNRFEALLESKIREAYIAGAEAMRDAMTIKKSQNCPVGDIFIAKEHGYNQAIDEANLKAQAFLATLKKPAHTPYDDCHYRAIPEKPDNS